ncbi:MAG: response regulator [Armatimonadetes bacterium]|nr:response regulator [Armatimonadota bacterium]
MLRIALIEDAPAMRKRVTDLLTCTVTGYAVEAAQDLQTGLALLQTFQPNLMVLDLVFPEADGGKVSPEHGRTVLRYVRERMPQVKVIVLTTEGDRAREFLIEEGADDFLCKASQEEWRTQKLLRQVERLIGHVPAHSEAGKTLAQRLGRMRATDRVIMLEGEAGVGKRTLAGMIHASYGGGGKLGTLALTAVPPQEVLPMIIGERVPRCQDGMLMNGGTCVVAGLEEVAALPHAIQAGLAAVVSSATEGGFAFSPVGVSEPMHSDGRLIFTTTHSLAALARSGAMTAGLASALRGARHLVLPPLRECAEDVEEYALYFLRLEAAEQGRPGLRLADAALAALDNYGRGARWPGNHAELRQAIATGVSRADGDEIGAADLDLPEFSEDVGVRLYSFLSMDVVRSKRMKLGQDPEAVRQSFEAYHAFVARTVATGGGEIYATSGDGIMCRFGSARAAVNVSRAIIRDLGALNAGANRLSSPFCLRVGISTGQAPDIGPEEGGTVASETIDRAATLQECAEINTVLACAETYRLAGASDWQPLPDDPAPGLTAFVVPCEGGTQTSA